MKDSLSGDAFEMPVPPVPLMPVTRTGVLPFAAERPPPVPALRIRRADTLDQASLVRMAVRFVQESPYRSIVSVNLGQLELLVQFLLDHGAIFVVHIEATGGLAGMIAVSVIPHPIGGDLVGTEVAWWIDPSYRGGTGAVRLLERAEQWAREQGALRFQMIAPVGERTLHRLYERRGYVEVETLFQRELPPWV